MQVTFQKLQLPGVFKQKEPDDPPAVAAFGFRQFQEKLFGNAAALIHQCRIAQAAAAGGNFHAFGHDSGIGRKGGQLGGGVP